MGFLDRMVADLIGDATGLPVKRLIRGVGVKNILLLGGAAAAGGYAVQRYREQQSAPQPGGAASVVPPPPPPAATVAPPPPPAAGQVPPPPPPPGAPAAVGATPPPPPVPELPPALEQTILRTMVAAGLADGRLAPEERQAMQGRLAESGMAEEQLQQLRQDMVLPPTPAELAALISEPGQRPVLYRAALLMVRADREVSQLERTWLNQLATALGLDESERTQLEQELRSGLSSA